MPDPSVSSADTIRQALAHLDSYCEPCLFSENAHAALDALLAVGERDKADAQLALDALPDPMHPALRQWADAMTDAKILLAHVAGHDDPGDVEAARAVLADKEDAAAPATLERQVTVTICDDCSCQAKKILGGWSCPCCGDRATVREVTVTALVPVRAAGEGDT